ncbi:hypothetical protein [Streptomyces sp. IMTB 1903]|uniref:hypothetical protein n=1 Tax=Streptomyces sp. IMTB 1903 TaxID=1776680 RepID=UPI00075D5D6A|nr:hypothetical protein [Streptomyces sp. IMTB 1903]
MEYRESRARVPLDDDAKRAAQKSTIKDHAPQVNPITMESRQLTEEEGHRPGCFSSEMVMDPDMQRPDGWRPSGSYSPSSVNTEERESRRWARRMVVDDASEYGHAVRRATGNDSLYYRSGRPKLGVSVIFRDGAESAER